MIIGLGAFFVLGFLSGFLYFGNNYRWIDFLFTYLFIFFISAIIYATSHKLVDIELFLNPLASTLGWIVTLKLRNRIS